MLTTENHKWFKVVGTKISFEHVNSWAKILLFRTHHLWNSMLILNEFCRRLPQLSTLMTLFHSRFLQPSFLRPKRSCNDATKSSKEKRSMKVTFILVFINIVISALTSDVISAGKLRNTITVLMSNYILLYLLSMCVYLFQETNPNYH